MKITLLGCGGSTGVPTSTGDWGACDPADIRNYRRRPAILVEINGKAILIDTPPELREQLLRARATRIDAVFFTHTHADHVHGIDDVRPFYRRTRHPIPAYGAPNVLAEIRRSFGYAVEQGFSRFYSPILEPIEIKGDFDFSGVRIQPFPMSHGDIASTGFRIGDFAYTVDVQRMSENGFDILDGISHWIVDCQQIQPHPTHSHLAQTLDWIARIKPKRAVLTHMGPGLDYGMLAASLPESVEPGYDGLVMEF